MGQDETEKTEVLLCCSLNLGKTVMAKALHTPQATPSPQKIPIKPQVDQREAVCYGWIKKNPEVHLTKHSLRQFQRTRYICSASPEHSRPSQKSAGWFHREPAASSAPLLHGTDWSGRSPGNIPEEQEGF